MYTATKINEYATLHNNYDQLDEQTIPTIVLKKGIFDNEMSESNIIRTIYIKFIYEEER